jgi:hypothetical protein
MKGTSSFTSAGVSSETGSTPHDFAEDIRRASSCIRSSVRATSIPPDSVKTPSSRYCRTLSSVSAAISFEWSTGKMKFDAWPVEPPGFGSGPLSRRTTSLHPSLVRWYATLLPTIPQPMTTARASRGTVLIPSCSSSLRENASMGSSSAKGMEPGTGPGSIRRLRRPQAPISQAMP